MYSLKACPASFHSSSSSQSLSPSLRTVLLRQQLRGIFASKTGHQQKWLRHKLLAVTQAQEFKDTEEGLLIYGGKVATKGSLRRWLLRDKMSSTSVEILAWGVGGSEFLMKRKRFSNIWRSLFGFQHSCFHFMILGRRLTGLYNLCSAECIDNHPTDSGMQSWNKHSELTIWVVPSDL